MDFRKAVMVASLSVVVVIGLIAQAGAATPNPLSVWTQRNPLPQLNNHLYGVASNGKTSVAVGKDTNPLPNGGGRIITSTDGYNWVVRKSAMVDPTTGAPVIPYAAAFGAVVDGTQTTETWIVVCNKGTILKSVNGGVTWTTVLQGKSDDDELRGITFGKGVANTQSLFVAVGKTGKVLTSPDGDNWTKESCDTNSFLNGIAFGKGIFVAVGNVAASPLPPLWTIITSKDGKNWDMAFYPAATTQKFMGITYGNGAFVAVGSYSTQWGYNVMVSTDDNAATWNGVNIGDTGAVIDGVAFGNDRFVAVSSLGSALVCPLDPTQPGNWSKWASGVLGFPSAGSGSNLLNGVAFLKNVFVAVGSDTKLLTSADGQSWTERASVMSNFLFGAAYGNGTYAAVGWGGKVLTSSDKITWVERSSNVAGSLFGITYGNNKFVAVGSGGSIVTSTTGTTWPLRTSGIKDALFGVAFGNKTFVAVGAKGRILTSSDGLTWKVRTSDTTDFLYGISYVNNTFVAVGQNGTVLSSTNGIAWTKSTITYTSTFKAECLYGVTYGGNVFVVVGDNGRIMTSPDLSTWTNRTSGCVNGLRAAAYANNTMVVVGSGGKILTSTSPDGITWSPQTSGINYSLSGMAYDGTDTLVVVGAYATILSAKYDQATPWKVWTIRSTGTYKQLKAIAFGNDTFVAVGESGTVLTSKNGVTWGPHILPTTVTWLNGVAYGNSRFVAVGDSSNNGRVFTSEDDGVTWKLTFPLAYFTPSNLWAVTFGNGRFLAAGVDGIELVSYTYTYGDPPTVHKAGDWWFEEYLEGCYDTKGVTYGDSTDDGVENGNFVMVGSPNRTFLTSTKPEAWWMIRWAPFFPQDNALGFTGIAYGGGIFVVVGPKVKIGKSLDGGVKWNQVPLKNYTGTFDFTGISYGGSNTFTAVGTYGKIVTSSDAKNWTFRNSKTTQDLNAMIYGGGASGNTYVVVGKNGTILQSGKIILP